MRTADIAAKVWGRVVGPAGIGYGDAEFVLQGSRADLFGLDDRARGLPGTTQAVYHVRFAAADRFGDGDHAVTVELWEDYLEPADPQGGTP